MKLKITDKKVFRLAHIEIISSQEANDDYRYVNVKMRVMSRLVEAFAYRHKGNRAVVTIYEDDHEHRYWLDSRITNVNGLRRLAMAVLRHHDQAKAEVGS